MDIYVWPNGSWATSLLSLTCFGDDFRHVVVPDTLSEELIDSLALVIANGASQTMVDLLVRMHLENTP